MLLKVKGDWEEVVNDCRTTVGKGELGKEPSAKFKLNILIAEHSPIRDISFKWKWTSIKSWIATHWSRHKWECFIETQRDDRTGVNRDESPQGTLVTFTGEANIQHLIDTMRKRLCYCAHKETVAYAKKLRDEIAEVEPTVAMMFVPNCVYRCGCPETDTCGKYKKLCEKYPELMSTDIKNRYAAFEFLYRQGEW